MMRRAALALLLLIAACADKPPAAAVSRYLSAEEDAHLRAECEPAGGCAVVPVPLFQKLMQTLKACHDEHSL